MDRNWFRLHDGDSHHVNHDYSPENMLTGWKQEDGGPTTMNAPDAVRLNVSSEDTSIAMTDSDNAGLKSSIKIRGSDESNNGINGDKSQTPIPSCLSKKNLNNDDDVVVEEDTTHSSEDVWAKKQKQVSNAFPIQFDEATLRSCIEQLGHENQCLRQEIRRLHQVIESYRSRQVLPLERALTRVTRDRNAYKRKLDKLNEKHRGRLQIQQEAHDHALRQYQNMTDMYKEQLANALENEEEEKKEEEEQDELLELQQQNVLIYQLHPKLVPCHSEEETKETDPMDFQGTGSGCGDFGEAFQLSEKIMGTLKELPPPDTTTTQTADESVLEHMQTLLGLVSGYGSQRRQKQQQMLEQDESTTTDNDDGCHPEKCQWTRRRNNQDGQNDDDDCCLDTAGENSSELRGLDLGFWLQHFMEKCLVYEQEREQVVEASLGLVESYRLRG